MNVDWTDKEYAQHYNTLYASSAAEFAPCIEALNLKQDDEIIDFGCGNGSFLALAAPKVHSAIGIDMSAPQIEEAKHGLKNFENTALFLMDFLSFRPKTQIFTKAFSRKALHHLTNIEKEIFLQQIAPAFVKGALFLLEDGMYFDFPRSEIQKNMPKLIQAAKEYYGETWKAKEKDIMHSFNEEFAAGVSEWETFFSKAGFKVISKEPKSIFYGTIKAIKL